MADPSAPNSEQSDEGFVRANVERNVIKSPTFTDYYANDTQIQTSPWDVRLMFGLIMEVDPVQSRAVVQQVADVRISLQHAKKLAAILTQQLQQHEAKIGYIALPPD